MVMLQSPRRLVASSPRAREVIAFVDDDAPPGDPERDRTPANRLCDSMGFQELDRLWSFTRSDVLDPKAYVQGVGGSGSESSRSSLRSQSISDEESASGADDSDRVSVVRSPAVS